MSTQEQADFAVSVFTAFIDRQSDRLVRGLARRAVIIEKMKQGIMPEGERVQWLNSTARSLFGVMAEAARDFNETHPDDLISVTDLGDVLETARLMLQTAIDEDDKTD